MPTITHAFVGGAIALLLFSFTKHRNLDKSFNKEHVILFALNSFVGPDYPKFFSPFLGPDYRNTNTFYILHDNLSHTIVGWIIWSIIFALIYYCIFRFATKARKTNTIPISLLNTYLVILAAGMFHFALDMLDSSVKIFPAIFSSDTALSIEFFMTGNKFAIGPMWETMSWFGNKHLLIIGILFLILLIWMLYHGTEKNIWLISLGFGILVYGLIWLVGGNIVHNENDLGFMIYALLFWIGPISVLFLTMEYSGVEENTFTH